ncbi:MAG: hypothetical protein OQL08_02005 [Gammaproteobacteria bacterium]|nr:hypothetical protein [Gammaproteobacteria bacterium]
MTRSSLTLLLPGLQPSFDNDTVWPEMPALQTLLSTGRRERSSADHIATLFTYFGVPVKVQGDLPVAPLCALSHGLDVQSGWWLCVDPVHLLVDRDQLYLSAYRELALSQPEADALVTELNKIYAEDGWLFSAASPQRWLLRLPQPLALSTTPTEQALGQRVGAVLPQGKDAMAWQRVMTEVQMILHASPVNERRAGQGKKAVNGLWFWGGGSLGEAVTDSGWGHVIASDCLSRGLARLHGVSMEEPSSTTLATLSQPEPSVLWVDDSLQSPLPIAELFEQLECQRFTPLLAMVQGGELAKLVIDFPGVGRWTVDRAALSGWRGWRGRWWRRRKPLAELLKRH